MRNGFWILGPVGFGLERRELACWVTGWLFAFGDLAGMARGMRGTLWGFRKGLGKSHDNGKKVPGWKIGDRGSVDREIVPLELPREIHDHLSVVDAVHVMVWSW